MVTVQEIESLKKTVEDLKQKIAQTQGRLKQLKGANPKPVEAIRREMIELEGKRVDLEEKYEVLLSRFKRKYHEHFGEPPEEDD